MGGSLKMWTISPLEIAGFIALVAVAVVLLA
jgi:hypothetical protein